MAMLKTHSSVSNYTFGSRENISASLLPITVVTFGDNVRIIVGKTLLCLENGSSFILEDGAELVLE